MDKRQSSGILVDSRQWLTSQQAQAQHSRPGMPGPGGRGRGARIERAKDVQGTVRRLLSLP